MARVIGEIRPWIIFVENSSMLTGRGLGRVLGDLAEMRYNARWIVLGADDTCGPHERKRIWIMAYANEFNDKLSGYGTS
jgi:DNA (cytosine-5)-methyltransferase 1